MFFSERSYPWNNEILQLITLQRILWIQLKTEMNRVIWPVPCSIIFVPTTKMVKLITFYFIFIYEYNHHHSLLCKFSELWSYFSFTCTNVPVHSFNKYLLNFHCFNYGTLHKIIKWRCTISNTTEHSEVLHPWTHTHMHSLYNNTNNT